MSNSSNYPILLIVKVKVKVKVQEFTPHVGSAALKGSRSHKVQGVTRFKASQSMVGLRHKEKPQRPSLCSLSLSIAGSLQNVVLTNNQKPCCCLEMMTPSHHKIHFSSNIARTAVGATEIKRLPGTFWSTNRTSLPSPWEPNANVRHH